MQMAETDYRFSSLKFKIRLKLQQIHLHNSLQELNNYTDLY